MSQENFEQINNLLQKEKADYEVMEHAAEGRCQEVSDLRGNKLEEANKALVVRAKISKKKKRYFLLALRADQNADFSKIGDFKDVRLCNPEKVKELTGCEVGAVPPFSFHEDLEVIVDPKLLENEMFWFNAGLFDKSIHLNSKDYVRIVKPEIKDIARDESLDSAGPGFF